MTTPGWTMVTIRPLTSTDIPAVLRVWQDTVARVQDVDTPDQLARFLERNPGVCQVAEYQGHIIGLSIAGHDGRRGTLYHVCVALAYRRHGIGRKLIECSFDALRQQGQSKIHIQFKESNTTALRFWKAMGVRERNDLVVISLQL